MSKVFYDTTFSLSTEVEDVDLAQEFLQQDDMTKYLPERLKGIVTKVEWILFDSEYGTIDVEAERELQDDELTELSEWIRGQNSDGLGESFEQQGFEKSPFSDVDYGYSDYDAYYETAQFDWKTNMYPLQKKN